MANPYSYQPLPAKSIRVITLFPSRRRTDALKCSIKHVHLDHVAAQPYEALSYVWGEPTRQWPLDCDAKELLVTKNCHEALVNLRSRFFPRTLWIDAICINQGETDEAVTERNGQVAMMGEIYLKASRVLIWMGPADEFTPTLFRYLRSLRFFSDVETSHPRLAAILEPVVSQNLDISHGWLIKSKTTRLLDSLSALLMNPWFERVWTLQEVAFARKCRITQGHHTLDWESLCLGYLAIPTRALARHSETERLLSRWKPYLQLRGRSLTAIPPTRFQGEGQAETELQLLAEIRNMKASIPHDKVYSLYALFQVMGLDLPSPDYRKDVATVYDEAVLVYIRRRQDLSIITITSPPDENSGYPSWVPDWLTPGRYSEPLVWKVAAFDAKPATTVIPTLTRNTGNGKLGVMGKSIGVIQKQACCPLVGEPGLCRDEIYQRVIDGCFEWRRLVDHLAPYPSGKDPKLIQAMLLRTYHHAISRGVLKPWYRWLLLDGCGDGDVPAIDDAALDEMTSKYRPKPKWVVYFLDTGYCGMAHRACCIGDVVALLPTLHPLVLRGWKKDGEYRVVTPAYCEGAMSGEVNPTSEESEEIVLI